jgi:NAD-dependent DNA ligase
MSDIKSLVKTLKMASHNYYETDKPSMTDEEYDVLRERLYELDPANSFFNEVGSLPEKARINLPHAMPSLRKIKPDTLSGIRLSGPFVITDKLDGISALWTCGPNRKPGLYLRGNGLIGQDVSHMKVQGLKQGITSFAIRGELIVPRSEGVARNWVNGVLHKDKPSKADCDKIHFVAYQVIEPSGLTRSQQMTWLKNQGFETPGHYTVKELKAEEMTTLFKSTRENSPYECDGIVVGTDTVPLITTDALPKDTFAYKVAVDDQRAETTVKAIEWASSRLGEWIPRIRFDPVKIGVATIEFCTGVHAQYIKEHMLGPGARIVVRRSGDVIPTLDRVLVPASTWQEPPQGRWKWDGIHAIDTTEEKTSDTLALEMAHSLINLGVEGLSATSTKKLVEGGFKDLKAVWSSTEAQLQECLGKVSGSKLRTALTELKATNLQWIHAYHGWPKGFGERKIASTLTSEPEVSKWSNLKVPPVGQTMTTFSEVCKYVPGYLAWRAQFNINAVEVIPNEVIDAKCNNGGPYKEPKGRYVMTGFRDAELSAKLAKAGWILQERINKETTVLLVADMKESTKTKAALEKGIRIVLQNNADSLF